MNVVTSTSKSTIKRELVFSEKYLKSLPEELQVYIFEMLNPNDLAKCCYISKDWRKRINHLVQTHPSVQTTAMMLMRKVLMNKPQTIKAPYIMWPVMDASHGKVAYNTIDKDYRDKKFIVYDIATKKEQEVETPPSRLINYNFLKLTEKQLILGSSPSLSIINISQQETAKKETEAKQSADKQLLYQTGLGRHVYHEGMQIAAGMGYQDNVIAIDQPGKGLFHIPIDAVADYTGEYLRNAINIINDIAVIAFQFYRYPEGTPNITHVDSYSLVTRKLLYRVPFVNESMSLPTPMVSTEKRIAIAFSSGRIALLNAIDGTFVQEEEEKEELSSKDTQEREISQLYMDDQRLIVAFKSGMISIWNPEKGTLIQTLDRTKDDYPKVDKLLVHQNILVIISERCIQFWEMISGKILGERLISNAIMDQRLDFNEQSATLVCRMECRGENDKIKPGDGDILVWHTEDQNINDNLKK